MKKKICLINCSSRGSTGNLVNDLSRFCSSEYDFCYILGDRPDTFNKNNTLLISYNSFLYKISRSQTFVFGNDGFLSYQYYKKIKKFLDKQKPDLIHLHNPHRSFLNIDAIIEYCEKNNVKIIWTLHDEWAITGRCCCTLECKMWQKGCGNCEHKQHYPRCLFDRSNYFFSKKRKLYTKLGDNLLFITPSNWLFNRVKTAGISNPIQVINNGVDTSVFKISEKAKEIVHFSNGRIAIGGAALYLNDSKGLNVFIELSKRLPSTEYVIVLIGADIKTPQNISDNLLLLPRTSSKKEMSAFYNSIDIFVNPTKSDNYPTTHLESISCGTPVITYNVGGSSETVINGVNGFSVDYGDIDGIIDKINYILSNNKMFTRSSIIQSKNTSSEECCEKYFKLYREYIKTN